MNGFLLDTCVFAEYKKKIPNQVVLNWIAVQTEDSLFISVITLGEIKKGAVQLPVSQRRSELEQWAILLKHRFGQRVLPLDADVLLEWGALCGILAARARVLPVIDSLLAATALVRNLTVVTNNEADFDQINVRIFNPWK